MILRQSVGWLQQILWIPVGKISTDEVRFSHPKATPVTLYPLVN